MGLGERRRVSLIVGLRMWCSVGIPGAGKHLKEEKNGVAHAFSTYLRSVRNLKTWLRARVLC